MSMMAMAELSIFCIHEMIEKQLQYNFQTVHCTQDCFGVFLHFPNTIFQYFVPHFSMISKMFIYVLIDIGLQKLLPNLLNHKAAV